jgi:hypothetical protein
MTDFFNNSDMMTEMPVKLKQVQSFSSSLCFICRTYEHIYNIILWRVDPLLGNNRERSSYARAVAR